MPDAVSFTIIWSEEALIIRRRRRPAVLSMLFCGVIWGLFLAVPAADLIVYHTNIPAFSLLAAISTLLALPLFVGYGRYLANRLVVLDKSQDRILVNGRQVGLLTDVRRVDFGRYVVPSIRHEPSGVSGLYLEMADGGAVEIERLTSAGPTCHDLKEVGLVIADFAQVRSNVS